MMQDLFRNRRVIALDITDGDFSKWLERIGNDDCQIYYNSDASPAANASAEAILHYGKNTPVNIVDGDILLLERDSVRHFKKFSLLKKFEHICARPTLPGLLFIFMHLIRYFASGMRVYLSIRPVVNINGRHWLHFIVRKTARKRDENSPRIYMHKHWTVEDLFANLNQDGINYVVLRWWDKLSHLSASDDIDILVADEDFNRLVEKVSAGKKGRQALDVYSVTGNQYSSAEVTYYEPGNARAILADSRLGPCKCRMPRDREAFLSLAYHALYHKGFNAGLKSEYSGTSTSGKFQTTLSKYISQFELNLPLTMESLDEYLHECGWRPPADKLSRLAVRNEWIRRHFFNAENYLFKQGAYIGAFVLRTDCVRHNAVDFTLREIEKAGFRIIKRVDMQPRQIRQFSERMRGGNWENNLLPEILVIVSDDNPLPVKSEMANTHFFLDNANMLQKLKIRETLDRKYNVKKGAWLHGCDNITEAKEYIAEIAPDMAETLFR